MKKFLISILVILLLILTYFIILKNVTIATWKSKSINDIKNANNELNAQIDMAKQINNQEYPQSIEKLENSIRNLKVAKEKYETKLSYVSDNAELGVVEIKEYKIERLWITLENYAKDNGLDLQLDLLDTSTADKYDLDITIIGGYIGITDFIYDIEGDDTLGFKIQNFKLTPNTSTTENTSGEEENGQTSTSVDTNTLKATFKIEGVGIEFN